MDILITEEQLKRIIKEQKIKYTPPTDNVPKSDYLGKGGEFERSQRSRQNLHLDKNPLSGVKTFSETAINLIKKWEKFKDRTYLCSSGKKTIGYGTRIEYHPELRNTCITEAKAIQILKDDLNKNFVSAINKFVRVPLNQNEFDALISLIYNIGRSSFVNSKLLNDINSGNLSSLRKNWSEFRKDGGGVSNGLVNRRSEEIRLFTSR
jgi:lysozyme